MKNRFSFGQQPVLRRKRSKFDLSFSNKTSMSVGKLYPIYLQEIYPGDTFKCDTSIVTRVSSAFLKPVMDNIFMDVHFFFVPNRLVLTDWSEVMGENNQTPWSQIEPVAVPVFGSELNSLSRTVVLTSVADYLGLPLGVLPGNKVSKLPFRAFALIWDQWYRDQNIDYPMNINKGFSSTGEALNNSEWGPNNYMGKLPPVSKTHDYFTSCLPSPQKGESVDLISNISVPAYSAPVHTSNSNFALGLNEAPLRFGGLGGDLSDQRGNAIGLRSSSYGNASLGGSTSASLGAVPSTGDPVPINLFANIRSIDFASFNVNDLRNAIALQRMLEKDAEGGTRYTEYLLSHFGVSSPDMRLDRTELLGGARLPLSVQQVAQTSQATEDSPLGGLGAYSLSNGRCRYTKGFTEHGYVIGVACLKYYHTYQQGIERFFMRSKRTDFYDPVFANIGNQPVYTTEIFAGVSNPNQIFGYNEAWADLRYRPNKVTGMMRSPQAIYPNDPTFDIWHFADNYDSAPTLNSQFIHETPTYVDRTLAVPSDSEDQFIVDIYHKQTAYRVLPVYSTPSHLGVR